MTDRLNTVAGYLEDARAILLDQRQPYRYSNEDLLTALNTGFLEGRRLRADLFLRGVPYFHKCDESPIPIEPQFRLAFVYATVAHALVREDEDIQDERAASFLGMFQDMLVGVRPRPPAGGRPTKG